MMKIFGLIAAVLLAALLNGCETVNVKSFSEREAGTMIRRKLLVFPAFAPPGISGNSGTLLGRGFSDKLRMQLKEQIVFTEDINQLAGQTIWQDMFKNNEIDLKEVSENARTLDCESAFVIRIISLSQAPPYYVQAELTWVNAGSSAVIMQLTQQVSLADMRTRLRFDEAAPPPVKNMLPRTDFGRFTYFAGTELAGTVIGKTIGKSFWASFNIFD